MVEGLCKYTCMMGGGCGAIPVLVLMADAWRSVTPRQFPTKYLNFDMVFFRRYTTYHQSLFQSPVPSAKDASMLNRLGALIYIFLFGLVSLEAPVSCWALLVVWTSGVDSVRRCRSSKKQSRRQWASRTVSEVICITEMSSSYPQQLGGKHVEKKHTKPCHIWSFKNTFLRNMFASALFFGGCWGDDCCCGPSGRRGQHPRYRQRPGHLARGPAALFPLVLPTKAGEGPENNCPPGVSMWKPQRYPKVHQWFDHVKCWNWEPVPISKSCGRFLVKKWCHSVLRRLSPTWPSVISWRWSFGMAPMAPPLVAPCSITWPMSCDLGGGSDYRQVQLVVLPRQRTSYKENVDLEERFQIFGFTIPKVVLSHQAMFFLFFSRFLRYFGCFLIVLVFGGTCLEVIAAGGLIAGITEIGPLGFWWFWDHV